MKKQYTILEIQYFLTLYSQGIVYSKSSTMSELVFLLCDDSLKVVSFLTHLKKARKEARITGKGDVAILREIISFTSVRSPLFTVAINLEDSFTEELFWKVYA